MKLHKQSIEKIQLSLGLSKQELDAVLLSCISSENPSALIILVRNLLGLFKAKTLKEWVRVPDRAFKNKSPVDLLILGDVETLQGWVYSKLERKYG